jgi:hypothetical protein
MAGIDYETAKRLAKQIIAAGNSEGVPFEQLVKNIMRQPEPGQGTSPDGAIASALMFQPPQMVTPAAPAPVRPGVQLAAPKPTAQLTPGAGGPLELPEDVRRQTMAQEAAAAPQAVAVPEEVTVETVAGAPREGVRPSRYRQLLAETLSELGNREKLIQQAQNEGREVPITEQARIRALTDRANALKGYVQAEESAMLPEEMQTALTRQEERLARQEERIKEEKRLSPWDALAQASFAMGQGRKGERFTEALNRGLQAGLQTYSQAKNESAESLEAVGAKRDEIALKRYDLIQKARDDAVGMIKSGMTMDKDILALAKMTNDEAMQTALMPFALSKAQTEDAMGKLELQYAPEKLATEIRGKKAYAKYYEEGGGRGGSGDGKPMTENQRITKIGQLNREKRAALVEMNTAGIGPAQRQALQDAIRAIDLELEVLSGKSPFVKPAGGPLAGKPALRWDPKAGLLPNK